MLSFSKVFPPWNELINTTITLSCKKTMDKILQKNKKSLLLNKKRQTSFYSVNLMLSFIVILNTINLSLKYE